MTKRKEKGTNYLADEFLRRLRGQLPANFDEQADAYISECVMAAPDVASRKASQQTLNALGPCLPELFGGSADLAGSNLSLWSGAKGISAGDAAGNYVYYGVREFAHIDLLGPFPESKNGNHKLHISVAIGKSDS